MAVNEKAPGIGVRLTVSSSEVTGNPVLVGAALVGVVETNPDASNISTVNVAANRIWSLSVKGIDGGGNSAVAVGDKLYIVMADTPRISKKATGVFFGYALGTVGSGSTATIDVLLAHA